MGRWEHLLLRAPRSEHEPSAQSSRARWRRAVCRRASRSHEACLSRVMPPFEPTISHFIFKLEQSVLMCCTCVCPGQRMTQIHTECDVPSSVMLMAHGTWDMAILAFQDLALSGVNRSIVMPNTCRKECARSKFELRRKRVDVRRERFEVLMKIEVCVVRRYRYGFRWFCFSRGPCAVGGCALRWTGTSGWRPPRARGVPRVHYHWALCRGGSGPGAGRRGCVMSLRLSES